MYLEEYQTFNSKHKLNNAINEHLTEHKYVLTESARKVLTLVSQYAVKFPGVAHLKAMTIARAIDLSEKTVRRALNLLSDLHIIKKVATTRKVSGGQGANIIVILPYDQAQVSKRGQAQNTTGSKVEGCKNESEPFYSSKQNINKDIYIPDTQFDDFESNASKYAAANGVPTELVDELKAGLRTSEIVTIWKSIKRTLNKYKADYTTYYEQIVNAIRRTISLYRFKKNRLTTKFNFTGCICGLVKKNIKNYLANRMKEARETNNWFLDLTDVEKETALLIDVATIAFDIDEDTPY